MRAFEEKDKSISIGTSNDGASLMATHLYTTSHLQSKSHAVTKVSARPFQSCSHGHLQAQTTRADSRLLTFGLELPSLAPTCNQVLPSLDMMFLRTPRTAL